MSELYPGIDLQVRQELIDLKYDFIVQPDIDPSQILIQYTGQENLKIDKKETFESKLL